MTVGSVTQRVMAEQVAKASWLSPVIVCFILGLRAQWGPGVGLAIPVIVFLLAGIGLAVLSLFGVRREGSARILPQAVVGLIFNVFLFGMFFCTMRGE